MYYITKRTSETGKKFQVVENKIKEIQKHTQGLMDEIGFVKWRSNPIMAYGGFWSLIFEKEQDLKIFKRVNKTFPNEYMPRLNSKRGKEIQLKLDEAPVLTNEDLNSCIGIDDSIFRRIGFAWRNSEYFGFKTLDESECNIPSDCQEVTYSQYKLMFDHDFK